MRKACPKCGKRVEKSQQICPNCGQLLVSLSSDTTIPITASHAQVNLRDQPGSRRSWLGRAATKMKLMAVSAFVDLMFPSRRVYMLGRTRILNMTQQNQSTGVTLKYLRYGYCTSATPLEAAPVEVVLELGEVDPSVNAVVSQGGLRLASQTHAQEWDEGVIVNVVYFGHFDIDSSSQIDVTLSVGGVSSEYAFQVPARE